MCGLGKEKNENYQILPLCHMYADEIYYEILSKMYRHFPRCLLYSINNYYLRKLCIEVLRGPNLSV